MVKYYLGVALLALILVSCEESGEKIVEITPPSLLLNNYNFLVDKDIPKLIFYNSDGDFLFYDFETNEITDHLSIGGNVRNCTLDNSETHTELFVTSVRDSAILVFDSQTLTPTDTFFFDQIPYSVVSKDSLLFVSFQDSPGGISMYVVGRKGKEIIANYAGSGSHILSSLGSDDDINILMSQTSYYRYIRVNPGGSSSTSITKRNFGDYPTSQRIAAAPTGEVFVTEGTIINDKLVVLGSLPSYQYQEYYDFEFSNDSEYIFGSLRKLKRIHKYRLDGMQIAEEYVTKGYPHRIFCDRNDDDHLYVLSTNEATTSNKRYKLEKISLTN